MNIICVAFAHKEGHITSSQVGGLANSTVSEIYMKNAYVALASAKLNNPNAKVVFFTNEPLTTKWENDFTSIGIENYVLPFKTFLMPKEFSWSLAFYKLDVIKHIAENMDFDNMLLLDTDTVITKNLDPLFKDMSDKIMLYELQHPYGTSDRVKYNNVNNQIYNNNANIPQYGGEFIGGAKKEISIFAKLLEAVYNDIKKIDYSIDKTAGDEGIISIAASRYDKKIANAHLYIERYWTQNFFYVSSTNYGIVPIWHFPNEKKIGMLEMHKFLKKNKKMPHTKKMVSIFGMPKKKSVFNTYFRLMKAKVLKY